MSDIKLFQIKGQKVVEIIGSPSEIERSLQTLIEKHLQTFFGIRFLSSEYSTGKTHGGRIDSLGIDENSCPVIIEYKRAINENVMAQGLYYLDWLMDHKGEFELLVLKRFGAKAAEDIEWSSPRLLCIAGDFTKYDRHAVQQINRNIELVRYRHFGDDLFLLELVNAQSVASKPSGRSKSKGGKQIKYTTVTESLKRADKQLRDRFEALKDFLMNLGDDVHTKPLKFYFAFKRLKNFACVEVHPQAKKLLVYLKVNPGKIKLEKGFSRDVRKVGHFGTGDLEITLKTIDDFEKAKSLLVKSYDVS